MASNCTTKKVTAELVKAKGTRTIPRIDADLIMNLSTLITAENQDTCLCLRKITKTLSSSLKKYAYETDEFVKIKDIFLKLIQDCFLRIPLILEHSSGQKSFKDVNTNLRSIGQVLLEIANNGIEFRNYYFMHLFKMIMLVLFSRNEKIEFATQKILFLLVKDHIIELLPRTLKYLMNNNDDVLELLAIWLPNSADYEIQEAILEILMVFSARSKQKYIKMKNWFKNYPSFYKAIDNLSYNHFIESSREFLIEANKQITNNVKVYILPCVKAYADDIELKKPQSDLYKEFWIDFSVRSGHIQVYCSAGEGQWGKFSIDFSNVNCISNVNENSEWKVKIEFICPLEISIYSSKMNFKTITLYFPCSLKFQEIQNNFFLIVFPHIYKVENDYKPNGIRKHLRDKAMFEQSFFSRSSVISSIRPISPHRAMGLETSWSTSVRTSTPERTNDAGMENQKRKTSPSNICNEIDSKICDVEDRKIKSNCQQLSSNNQNEVNLNDKDETITPSVPNLQEVGSNKFTKVDEQSEEICFSTPTGEIDCETLNNGLNLIKNTHKNNIQHSNSKQTIKNIPESACTNVNKFQNCHDKANNEQFQEDRNISIENKNMVQSSELNIINVIYRGTVPKKASLDNKHLFSNFSTALCDLGSAKKESLHVNEGSVQKTVQTNLDDRENFNYKIENKMRRNCEKNNEKYKMNGHKPRSYRIGYNRLREIKELEKDTNEIANKRKSQKLVQRSNYEFKKTSDRIGEDQIKVYNYTYQDDQSESGRKKELHRDASEMKRKSQKVEQKSGIEIMKETHDIVEGKIMEYVSGSNQDDHLGSGIVKEMHKDVHGIKSKSQKIERETVVEMNKAPHDSEEEDKIKGYDPRSYEDNQFERGGIKELDNDTNLIKNKSQRVEQKSDNEMKKIPRESVEADGIKVCHPRSYEDNQFETGRMKGLDNDISLIKNKSQRVEQKSDNEMKKIPRESVEADEIKVCHPRSYEDNQFETGRMKGLDNDISLIKNKSQRVEQKSDNEKKKIPRESVEADEIKVCHPRSYEDNQFETGRMKGLDNDISLIKNKSQRVEQKSDNEMKKIPPESVEEQEIKVCHPRSNQDNQFVIEEVQELDNDIHVIKKKAHKVKHQSNTEIKNAQDFGFSVIRPIRTYSRSKYPKKSSILDNTSSAIFDSIKQTLDNDKINDSFNLTNDRLRSRRESNKRKLYTPGIKVHLYDSLDNDYEEQEDNDKKTKLFFPVKNVNIKKDHSPILFDDDSEAVNGDYIKTEYRSGTRKSNNMHELRNLPRKIYKEISTDESNGFYISENTRKYRKLELTTSPSDKAETSDFFHVSSCSASSKKPARKLLSYTRTKYGKSRTSNEGRNKKLQNSELIDDVKTNTENNNDEAVSNETLFTDNISASISKLDSLLENDLKDPVTNMLAKEDKKKMHDGISRMMINARSALSEEIIGHGKQYYDTVRKLQFVITDVGNQLKQMSTLCSDIENTTDLVNKAVSQPVNDRELHEFVSYLKENNYYLELSNEQVNDKNLIAKINAYFDRSMNNNE